MQVVKEVAVELAQFAIQEIKKRAQRLLSDKKRSQLLLSYPTNIQLGSGQHRIKSSTVPTQVHSKNIAHGTTQYVAVSGVSLLAMPTISFDARMCDIEYGSVVVVLELKGRFARIEWSVHSGWVLKDSLSSDMYEVFPAWHENEIYTHEHVETIKLRHCIKDAFFAGASEVNLSSGEYVTYCLSRYNQMIQWPIARPRTPGTWQHILRGMPSVHIGIKPKTGSVMEYTVEDHGQLAYVESVSPDQTIVLSYVLESKSPSFHRITMPRAQWIELQPVFINVI